MGHAVWALLIATAVMVVLTVAAALGGRARMAGTRALAGTSDKLIAAGEAVLRRREANAAAAQENQGSVAQAQATPLHRSQLAALTPDWGTRAVGQDEDEDERKREAEAARERAQGSEGG